MEICRAYAPVHTSKPGKNEGNRHCYWPVDREFAVKKQVIPRQHSNLRHIGHNTRKSAAQGQLHGIHPVTPEDCNTWKPVAQGQVPLKKGSRVRTMPFARRYAPYQMVSIMDADIMPRSAVTTGAFLAMEVAAISRSAGSLLMAGPTSTDSPAISGVMPAT